MSAAEPVIRRAVPAADHLLVENVAVLREAQTAVATDH